MAEPKKPQTSTPTPQGLTGKAIDQALYEYNIASDRLLTAKTEKDKKRYADEQARAANKTLKIMNEAGVFDATSEIGKKLTEVAPNLMVKLADLRQGLSKQASDFELGQLNTLRTDEREAVKLQMNSIFNAGMSSSSLSVNLLGVAKGIATLFKVFGADTDGFIQKCNDGIKSALADVPNIQYRELEKAPRTVNPSAAEQTLVGGTSRATQSIPGMTDKVMEAAAAVSKALDSSLGDAPQQSGTGPKSATRASSASAPIVVGTDKAVKAALANDGSGKPVKNKELLEQTIREIAGSDGDKEHLTAKELDKLDAKIVGMATPSQAAETMRRVKLAAEAAPAPHPN